MSTEKIVSSVLLKHNLWYLRVSQRIFKSDVFRSLFIAKIEIFTRNCYHSATSPLPNFLKNTVILKIPYFYRSVVWSKSYP